MRNGESSKFSRCRKFVLKTCMFCVVVETKGKCLTNQGKKLFFKNFQLIVVNQQRFFKLCLFKIKRNINENKNFKELKLQL